MKDIFTAIRERSSARMPFDAARSIPPEHLSQILEAARWSPTAHNMQNFQVIVVEDRGVLKHLALISSGVSEIFIRENYEQLSFSEEELKRKKFCILGTMFPLSWRNPSGRTDGMPKEQAPAQTRLAMASSALLVVLYDPRRRAPASEGDFLGIMSLGCVMQNMWLAADALGVGLQILSAFSAEGTEDDVKRILEVPRELRIAFTARLGYPDVGAPYLRVRREIGDFVHRDRFGQGYTAPEPQ